MNTQSLNSLIAIAAITAVLKLVASVEWKRWTLAIMGSIRSAASSVYEPLLFVGVLYGTYKYLCSLQQRKDKLKRSVTIDDVETLGAEFRRLAERVKNAKVSKHDLWEFVSAKDDMDRRNFNNVLSQMDNDNDGLSVLEFCALVGASRKADLQKRGSLSSSSSSSTSSGSRKEVARSVKHTPRRSSTGMGSQLSGRLPSIDEKKRLRSKPPPVPAIEYDERNEWLDSLDELPSMVTSRRSSNHSALTFDGDDFSDEFDSRSLDGSRSSRRSRRPSRGLVSANSMKRCASPRTRRMNSSSLQRQRSSSYSPVRSHTRATVSHKKSRRKSEAPMHTRPTPLLTPNRIKTIPC